MLVDFNQICTDLKGEKYPDILERIANALIDPYFMVGGPTKRGDLARDIYKKGEIEIDHEDLKIVRQAIEFTNPKEPLVSLPILVKNVLLKYLDNLKEDNTKKDDAKKDK